MGISFANHSMRIVLRKSDVKLTVSDFKTLYCRCFQGSNFIISYTIAVILLFINNLSEMNDRSLLQIIIFICVGFNNSESIFLLSRVKQYNQNSSLTPGKIGTYENTMVPD